MNTFNPFASSNSPTWSVPWQSQPSGMNPEITAAVTMFGVGVLVGAGVALLTAPKSGREVREDIGRAARGIGEKAGEITTTVAESMPALTQRSDTSTGDDSGRVQATA